jgi:hypothetical protein
LVYYLHMNEDVIADFKQFIAATVSQATAHLATKDDLVALEQRMDTRFTEVDKRFDKVDRRFNEVDVRFDEVQTAIADAMAASNDDIDERFVKQDARITKLEQQLA